DADDVALREREAFARDDARARREETARREAVVPEEEFDERLGRPLELFEGGRSGERGLPAPEDLKADRGRARRHLVGDQEARAERAAPVVDLGLRQVERILALDVARAHVVA